MTSLREKAPISLPPRWSRDGAVVGLSCPVLQLEVSNASSSASADLDTACATLGVTSEFCVVQKAQRVQTSPTCTDSLSSSGSLSCCLAEGVTAEVSCAGCRVCLPAALSPADICRGVISELCSRMQIALQEG